MSRISDVLVCVLNLYYDEQTGYTHFSGTEMNSIWGFSSRSFPSYLKELCEEGVIENHTVNVYYNRYKLNKIVPVPKFILNNKLTNTQKEFMLKCMEAEITEGISKKEWGRRVYGYECNLNLSKKITAIEEATGQSFWEVFDTEYTSIKYTPLNAIKFEHGYQTNKKIKIECSNDVTGILLKKSVHNARSKGFEHTLTQDYIREILEIQNHKDYYTGLPVEDNDWSVDRIDCSKGYIQGNIVLTHKIINIMRNDQSIEEFKKNIIALYENINNF